MNRGAKAEAAAMYATAGTGTLAFATGRYFAAVGIIITFAAGWSLAQGARTLRARRAQRAQRTAQAAAAADRQKALHDVGAFRELMRAAGARELEDR